MTVPAWSQVDLSGHWVQKIHEDAVERIEGPELGDYTGIPLNDAARMRAETWDPAKWAVPEHQCEPHPADYAPHGPASIRIWSEVEPRTQQIIAWHMVYHWMNPHRVIWMDGRPHPPEHAAHTWMGFSTGKWVGDTLVVTTTHLKEGWIRRNGIPRSDRATLTEYWMRHGNYLTVLSVVEDPVYLTEPFVRSWNWALDLGYQIAPYECAYRVESDLPKGFVAHKLPGSPSPSLEFAKHRNVPVEAARGGAETMYPEFAAKIDQQRTPKPTDVRTAATSNRKGKVAPRKSNQLTPRSSTTEELVVLPVRGSVYLIAGAGGNVIAQIGSDGVVLVDTYREAMSDRVLAAIGRLTDKPIRSIINTSANTKHSGGNAQLAKAGKAINPASLASGSEVPGALIYAHENVLRAMSMTKGGKPINVPEAWPTETYFTDSMELYSNGEAIRLIHAPSAHSDGDSIVHFRGSDVVSTGAIFTTTGYPVIDLERGGSINGIIDALNHVIELTIPARIQEGGTLVIPGDGRICDEYDVVIYRDMITVIRDRIANYIRQGRTLQEVIAARPTFDYDPRYNTEYSAWTADQFVEAVYRSLTQGAKK